MSMNKMSIFMNKTIHGIFSDRHSRFFKLYFRFNFLYSGFFSLIAFYRFIRQNSLSLIKSLFCFVFDIIMLIILDQRLLRFPYLFQIFFRIIKIIGNINSIVKPVVCSCRILHFCWTVYYSFWHDAIFFMQVSNCAFQLIHCFRIHFS